MRTHAKILFALAATVSWPCFGQAVFAPVTEGQRYAQIYNTISSMISTDPKRLPTTNAIVNIGVTAGDNLAGNFYWDSSSTIDTNTSALASSFPGSETSGRWIRLSETGGGSASGAADITSGTIDGVTESNIGNLTDIATGTNIVADFGNHTIWTPGASASRWTFTGLPTDGQVHWSSMTIVGSVGYVVTNVVDSLGWHTQWGRLTETTNNFLFKYTPSGTIEAWQFADNGPVVITVPSGNSLTISNINTGTYTAFMAGGSVMHTNISNQSNWGISNGIFNLSSNLVTGGTVKLTGVGAGGVGKYLAIDSTGLVTPGTPAGSGSTGILFSDLNPLSTNTTATEYSLYTNNTAFANTVFGTNGIVAIRLLGSCTNNSGSPANFLCKLYLNGSVRATVSISPASSATSGKRVEYIWTLTEQGVASSQWLDFRGSMGPSFSGANANAANTIDTAAFAQLTLDTTSTISLGITMTLGSSNAAIGFNKEAVYAAQIQ